MLDHILNSNPVKLKEEFYQLVSEHLLNKFQVMKESVASKMANKEITNIVEDLDEAATNPDIKNAVISKDEVELHHLSKHPDTSVRAQVTHNKHTSHATIHQMGKSEKDHFIISRLISSPNRTKESLESLSQNPNVDSWQKNDIKTHLANGNYNTFKSAENMPNELQQAIVGKDPTVLHHLSKHPLSDIRTQVARNKHTSLATLHQMNKSENDDFVKSNIKSAIESKK
jgi:hypothetical protein